MKYLKLYLGTKDGPEQKVLTFHSMRADLFHDRAKVHEVMDKWIDELFEQYDEAEGFDTENE